MNEILDPIVFLKASQILKTQTIALENCCCNALDKITGDSWLFTKGSPYIQYFLKLYTDGGPGDYLWENPNRTKKDQEARRLALLFAYEIAKEEQND